MSDKDVALLLVSILLFAHGEFFLADAWFHRSNAIRIQDRSIEYVINSRPYSDLLETSLTYSVAPLTAFRLDS